MGFAVGNEINKAIMELELMFMVYQGGGINEYYKTDMGLKSLTHLRPRKEQGLVFVTMLRFYMGKK